MPAPSIDATTSILSAVIGREFTFQPALAVGSDAADEWSATGLPEGLLCDAETGRITGVPEEGGVFVVTLTASNGSGAGTLNFPLGVELREFLFNSPAVEINIALESGAVSAPGSAPGPVIPASGNRPEIPGAIAGGKYRDEKLYAVGFTKAGILQELEIERLALALKEFETDARPLVETDGTFEKVGTGDVTRYLILLDLSDARVRAALANYEAEDGTFFSAFAEFEYRVPYKAPGEAVAVPRPVSSQSFRYHLERDVIYVAPASSSSSESSESSASSASSGSSASSASSGSSASSASSAPSASSSSSGSSFSNPTSSYSYVPPSSSSSSSSSGTTA